MHLSQLSQWLAGLLGDGPVILFAKHLLDWPAKYFSDRLLNSGRAPFARQHPADVLGRDAELAGDFRQGCLSPDHRRLPVYRFHRHTVWLPDLR